MKTTALINDYFRLFIKRESRVVIGKKGSNLWILSVLLVFTFFAIAFSNASLKYLSYKMNDPFINWVNIQNNFGEEDIDGLLYALSSEEIQETYHFHNYGMDYKDYYLFFGADHSQVYYPGCLFFESFVGNPLLEAILAEDNIIGDYGLPADAMTDDEQAGIIITEKQMIKMGYHKPYPAFVYLCRYSEGADTLGFSLFQGDFGYVPIPIIAIVEKLPMNADIIASKYLYAQNRNDYTYPFNINNAQYAASLIYFVPCDVNISVFETFISQLTEDTCHIDVPYLPCLTTYKDGSYLSVEGEKEALSWETTTIWNNAIMSKFEDQGVVRIYDYDFRDYKVSQGQFISVQFDNLKRVKQFGEHIEQYKVSIELSQINAKENFNAVSVLAQILTWLIVLFAIVCIVLFVVNLLQTHFQKIKKNMGTFKAFGMSNKELVSVYMVIMLAIVVSAIGVSLLVVLLTQGSLDLAGILREGKHPYLQVFNWVMAIAAIIIILSTSITVYIVMKRQLSSTPGNLINDR